MIQQGTTHDQAEVQAWGTPTFDGIDINDGTIDQAKFNKGFDRPDSASGKAPCLVLLLPSCTSILYYIGICIVICAEQFFDNRLIKIVLSRY